MAKSFNYRHVGRRSAPRDERLQPPKRTESFRCFEAGDANPKIASNNSKSNNLGPMMMAPSDQNDVACPYPSFGLAGKCRTDVSMAAVIWSPSHQRHLPPN